MLQITKWKIQYILLCYTISLDISKGTSKRDTRKIKEIMRKFEYDGDFVDGINDDFCLGWNAAKNIITQLLSDMYWENNKD